ncbi:MAG: hypothetical protein ACTH2Q_01580 [Propionibacteriaceae bacterium]
MKVRASTAIAVAAAMLVASILFPLQVHAADGIDGTASSSPSNAEMEIISQTTGASSREEAINIARDASPGDFALKVEILRSAESFYQALEDLGTDPDEQIEGLAALSTVQQVKDIKANSSGHHYVISTTSQELEVKLVNDATDEVVAVNQLEVGTYETPAGPIKVQLECAKAWGAFVLWKVGSGLLCGGITFAGVVPGVVCAGVVISAEMIINWNNAC